MPTPTLVLMRTSGDAIAATDGSGKKGTEIDALSEIFGIKVVFMSKPAGASGTISRNRTSDASTVRSLMVNPLDLNFSMGSSRGKSAEVSRRDIIADAISVKAFWVSHI